jgi:hypothetical protein
MRATRQVLTHRRTLLVVQGDIGVVGVDVSEAQPHTTIDVESTQYHSQ